MTGIVRELLAEEVYCPSGRKENVKWNPGDILCEVKKFLFCCVSNKNSQQYTF